MKVEKLTNEGRRAALPLWREVSLRAYYHSSLPRRWLRNRAMRAAGRAPITVLFYHRVADDVATPWTCSNRMFAQHIAWLKRHVDLISLAEAQARIQSGANHRPAACITFDDGYADNCKHALPLLIREKIPCVYFVSWQHVSEGKSFPHDAEWGNRFAINTIDELRELSRAGIEIGAHTRTHANLGAVHDEATLYDEVVTAGEELARAIGQPMRYFAFPYGGHSNLNARAFELAADAGYLGVCSAYGGYNFPGDDSFHIQRAHAEDNLIRLKNWVTFDPRKLTIERFEYRDQCKSPVASGVAQQ